MLHQELFIWSYQHGRYVSDAKAHSLQIILQLQLRSQRLTSTTNFHSEARVEATSTTQVKGDGSLSYAMQVNEKNAFDMQAYF